MSKTREILLQHRAELRKQLAIQSEPILKELMAIKCALKALERPIQLKATVTQEAEFFPSKEECDDWSEQFSDHESELDNYFDNWDYSSKVKLQDKILSHAPCSTYCSGCDYCRRGPNYR